MNAYGDYDETAALGSFGLTRGSLLRMTARERARGDLRVERGRSWHFDGDGCALQVARGSSISPLIRERVIASYRRLRSMLPRLRVRAI